jgi:D-serine/D-alanine/glycine transporter
MTHKAPPAGQGLQGHDDLQRNLTNRHIQLIAIGGAIGELLLSNLQYRSFIDFSADLLGPWAGFFTGWTYWFCWIVTGIADVIAISAYSQFWFPDLPQWAPAIACVGLLLGLNLLTVMILVEIVLWLEFLKLF